MQRSVANAGAAAIVIVVGDDQKDQWDRVAFPFVRGTYGLDPDGTADQRTPARGVPLLYVRGNHDVGVAWADAEHDHVPEPLSDGRVHDEHGLRVLPFSGAPRYAPHGRPSAEQQLSGSAMWRKVLRSWPGAATRRPLLVLTHAGGHGRTSGLDLGKVPTAGANLFHIHGGKVTRHVAYLKRDLALADLGLQE